jgi:hypothetical protein
MQFWDFKSEDHAAGGIYELRSYRLRVGRLLEWEQEWKTGLECRRQFVEPVGGWFSQVCYIVIAARG